MRTLQVHWRPRHITDAAAGELRQVLEQHPGDDEVLVIAYDDRVRLPLRVDAGAPGLQRAISEATDGACAIIIDPEEPPL